MKKYIIIIITIVLVVFKTYGQQVWEQIYNGKIANTFTQNSDNRFILAGAEYESMMQKWNIFNVDSMGNAEWDTIFYQGGPGNPTCIQALQDTSYIITGDNYGQIYFLKYNKNNQLLIESNVNINNAYVENITSLTITNDSNYIVVGTISTSNDPAILIAKIDNQGDSIWTKTYFYDYSPHIESIVKTNDSCYFCVGGNVDTQIWLLKINEQGDTLWTKSLDISSYDRANSIIKTKDSCFVINGITYGNDLFFMKIDQNGNNIWTKIYESSYSDNYSTSIATTFDNGYITANYMYNNQIYKYPWIMKLDNMGDSIWSIKPSVNLIPNKIIQTSDSFYVFLANTNNGSSETPRLIKIDSTSEDIISSINLKLSEQIKLSNFPNPFTNETNIIWEYFDNNSDAMLSITDVLGNIIFEKHIINKNNFVFTGEMIKSGIYYYSIKIEDKIYSGKMIKE